MHSQVSGGLAAVPRTIRVHADGSFDPPFMQVNEGETVVFTGPRFTSPIPPGISIDLPLPPTFSLSRVTTADLEANSCAPTSSLAYDITHDDPELDDELTGPMRRNAAGIFALGPQERDGFYEGPRSAPDSDLAADCALIGAAAGASAALSSEEWSGVTDGFTNNLLCRKIDREKQKVTSTNSTLLLESTWNDPDIAGGVVRIDWNDLYTSVVSRDGTRETIGLDFTKLDTELDRAVVRGKQVFLDIHAGSGLPPWIFTNYDGPAHVDATQTGIVPKLVVPISTRDFGSGDGGLPPDRSCGYDKTMGSPGTLGGDDQTEDALDAGRLAVFREITGDGSGIPALVNDEGKLFSPMHAGLQPFLDPTSCLQTHPTSVVNGKVEGDLRPAGTYSDNINPGAGFYSESGGCPNRWATREGYRGQVMGFQTTNDLSGADDLSAALWNGTLNSNMVYLEGYEAVLWHARQKRLAGEPYLSTVDAGFSATSDHQKSLGAWGAELRKRRRALAADPANVANPHMRDPYPTSYTFKFKKDLAPNARKTIKLIYPGRCASGSGAYGTITVVGVAK